MAAAVFKERQINLPTPTPEAKEPTELSESTKIHDPAPFDSTPSMPPTLDGKVLDGALVRGSDSFKQAATQTSYVSPSDAIMSPASKKLSDFKQRQMTKQNAGQKPRSLFQRFITTTREKDLGPQ